MNRMRFRPIRAVVVFSAICFVAVNLAVDLLYPVFDPRLRKQKVIAA